MERLADIIIRSLLKSFYVIFDRIESRQQNDRNMAQFDIILDFHTHLHTTHQGHHDIADNQIRFFLIRLPQSFLPISG